MFKEEIEIQILEHINNIEEQPEFNYSLEVEKADGFYIYSNSGKKYLDLTSNSDNNPLAYFSENVVCNNPFIDSDKFKSSNAITLENAVKNETGLHSAMFFSSNYDSYKFTSGIINKHLDINQKEKVLISCTQEQKKLFDLAGYQTDFIILNNESIVKTFFTRNTGAVIIQIAQVTDDLITADYEYLKLLRDLCDKNNALLIYDTSLISPLRINSGLFNYNQEVRPDLILASKGITQSIPFSLVALSEKCPDISKDRLNSGVYNPAYEEALTFIKNKDKYKKSIEKNIELFEEKLKELAETHISLVDFIFEGYILKLVVDIPAYDAAQEALSSGIILEVLNEYTLLLSPPYNIGEAQVNEFITVLGKIFDKLANFDRLK